MRSDTEDKAQQSTVDDPTTTKRSPLKETPSSLQRLRQAIAEEFGERRISAAVGRFNFNFIMKNKMPLGTKDSV